MSNSKIPWNRIVLWVGEAPHLYCVHSSGNRWSVENGGYTITIDEARSTATIVDEPSWRTNSLRYTKITEAPRGKDYNEVIERARSQQ